MFVSGILPLDPHQPTARRTLSCLLQWLRRIFCTTFLGYTANISRMTRQKIEVNFVKVMSNHATWLSGVPIHCLRPAIFQLCLRDTALLIINQHIESFPFEIYLFGDPGDPCEKFSPSNSVLSSKCRVKKELLNEGKRNKRGPRRRRRDHQHRSIMRPLAVVAWQGGRESADGRYKLGNTGAAPSQNIYSFCN